MQVSRLRLAVKHDIVAACAILSDHEVAVFSVRIESQWSHQRRRRCIERDYRMCRARSITSVSGLAST
jgi:hypothetical protein